MEERLGRARGLRQRAAVAHEPYVAWRTQRATAKSRLLIHVCVVVEISAAVASAEKSLKFLEQTIVMVEANRTKFDHIDSVGLSSCLVALDALGD